MVVGWLLGVITLFVVVAFGDDPVERVSTAFAASTIVATLAMAIILRREMKHNTGPTTATVIEALNDIPFEI